MDRSSEEERPYSGGNVWNLTTHLSRARSEDGHTSRLQKETKHESCSSPFLPKPHHDLDLLLAPRSYHKNGTTTSEDEDMDKGSTRSLWTEDDEETRSMEEEEDGEEEDEEEEKDMNAASAVGYASSVAWLQKRGSDPIDYLEVSIESLRVVAQQRGLETTALSRWSVGADGKILDPDHRKYQNLRDGLRAYTYLIQGVIPREDMYYLAILRKKVAQMVWPLGDGPISVMALGSVIPEKHFYTSKRLFPVRGKVSLVMQKRWSCC